MSPHPNAPSRRKTRILFFRIFYAFVLAGACISALVCCAPNVSGSKTQYNHMVGHVPGRGAVLALSLTRAALAGTALSFCSEYADVKISTSRISQERLNEFSNRVKQVLHEWLKLDQRTAGVAVVFTSKLNDETSCPLANPSQGKFNVRLYASESVFLDMIEKIFYDRQPTLGLYAYNALHLNMPGIFERDASRPYGIGIIRHELGHAFGLHHEEIKPSVMATSRANANATHVITDDDIAGYRALLTATVAEMNREGIPVASPNSVAPPLAPKPQNSTPNEQVNPVFPTEDVSTNPSTGTDANSACAEPNSPLVRDFSDAYSVEKTLPLKAGVTSFFKQNETQGAELPVACRCLIPENTSIRVMMPKQVDLSKGHVAVKLLERLPGCAFGKTGSLGLLYGPHWQ